MPTKAPPPSTRAAQPASKSRSANSVSKRRSARDTNKGGPSRASKVRRPDAGRKSEPQKAAAQGLVTVPQMPSAMLAPAVENVSRAVGNWASELGKAGTEAIRSPFASEFSASGEADSADYERLGQLIASDEATPSEINGLTDEILQKRLNKNEPPTFKLLETERDRHFRRSGKLSVVLAANHVFRKASQRLLRAQIEKEQKYVDDSLNQLLRRGFHAPIENPRSFAEDPFYNVDALVRGLEQLTRSERLYELQFGDAPNGDGRTRGSERALKRMLTEVPFEYRDFLEQTFKRMKEFYPEGKSRPQGPDDKKRILELGKQFWEKFSNQSPNDPSALQAALDLYAYGPRVATVLKEELGRSGISLDWGALNLKTFEQGLTLMPLWVALTTPLGVMRDAVAADSKILLDSPTVHSDIPLSQLWYRIKELQDAENVYTRTFAASPYSDKPNEVAQVIANRFFEQYPKVFEQHAKALFQEVTKLPPFTPRDDSMAIAGLAIHALTVRLLKQFSQSKFIGDAISKEVASDLVGYGPLLPRALEHETRVFKEQSARFEQQPSQKLDQHSEKLDHQMSLLALELAAQRYKELQSLFSERGDASNEEAFPEAGPGGPTSPGHSRLNS